MLYVNKRILSFLMLFLVFFGIIGGVFGVDPDSSYTFNDFKGTVDLPASVRLHAQENGYLNALGSCSTSRTASCTGTLTQFVELQTKIDSDYWKDNVFQSSVKGGEMGMQLTFTPLKTENPYDDTINQFNIPRGAVVVDLDKEGQSQRVIVTNEGYVVNPEIEKKIGFDDNLRLKQVGSDVLPYDYEQQIKSKWEIEIKKAPTLDKYGKYVASVDEPGILGTIGEFFVGTANAGESILPPKLIRPATSSTSLNIKTTDLKLPDGTELNGNVIELTPGHTGSFAPSYTATVESNKVIVKDNRGAILTEEQINSLPGIKDQVDNLKGQIDTKTIAQTYQQTIMSGETVISNINPNNYYNPNSVQKIGQYYYTPVEVGSQTIYCSKDQKCYNDNGNEVMEIDDVIYSTRYVSSQQDKFIETTNKKDLTVESLTNSVNAEIVSDKSESINLDYWLNSDYSLLSDDEKREMRLVVSELDAEYDFYYDSELNSFLYKKKEDTQYLILDDSLQIQTSEGPVVILEDGSLHIGESFLTIQSKSLLDGKFTLSDDFQLTTLPDGTKVVTSVTINPVANNPTNTFNNLKVGDTREVTIDGKTEKISKDANGNFYIVGADGWTTPISKDELNSGQKITALSYENFVSIVDSVKKNLAAGQSYNGNDPNILLAINYLSKDKQIDPNQLNLIQNDPKLLMAFASKGDALAQDKIVSNINSNSNFCDDMRKECSQVLFSVATSLTATDENKNLAQNALVTGIKSGYYKMSQEEFANLAYGAGLSYEDTQQVMIKINGGTDCDGFLGSMWCTITAKKDVRDIYAMGAKSFIEQEEAKLMKVSSNEVVVVVKDGGIFGKDDTITVTGCQGEMISSSKCQAAINSACGALEKKQQESCIKKATSALQSKSQVSKDDLDKFNGELLKKFNSLTKLDCDNLGNDCLKQVEDYCKSATLDDCNKMKVIYEETSGATKHQVDWKFSMLSAIRNPDEAGLKAAKSFGFEADYASLPSFLGESMQSSICLGKIEGYLDKTLENNGGVTKYGCADLELEEKDPNNKCIDVLGDVRAQRTSFSPDNTTTISYSYYIRAPNDEEIEYIVAVSYKEGGVTKKEILINKTKLEKGGQFRGFDYANIPVKDPSKVDIKSFRILLGGFYSGKTSFVNIGAPIVLITSGDLVEGFNGGNTNGNEIATSQEEEQQIGKNDIDILLDLMN